jgi:hypothetical protein
MTAAVTSAMQEKAECLVQLMDEMDKDLQFGKVRNSLKIHQLSHWEEVILEFGHPMHYNAETYESAHKSLVKKNSGVISFRYAHSGLIGLLKRDMLQRIVNGADDSAAKQNLRGLVVMGYDKIQPRRTWSNIKEFFNVVEDGTVYSWNPYWSCLMRNKVWESKQSLWLNLGNGIEWLEDWVPRFGVLTAIIQRGEDIALVILAFEEDDRVFPHTENTELDDECPNVIEGDHCCVMLWEDIKESIRPVQMIMDWRHYESEKKFFINRYMT